MPQIGFTFMHSLGLTFCCAVRFKTLHVSFLDYLDELLGNDADQNELSDCSLQNSADLHQNHPQYFPLSK